MVNNYTNINKMQNHLSPQPVELKQDHENSIVNNIMRWWPANISDRHSTNANLNLYVPINQTHVDYATNINLGLSKS
jgi:hypothetical protein